LKILLIDDNELVLETVSGMLSSGGHTIVTASNARDGLARLEAGESVDLVLADLNLPDIDGLEVVHRVRLHWPLLRVGLITGSLDQLPRQHDRLDLLLTKPVNLCEVEEAIKRLG
jgi:CheY-like chemotaxis protein